VSTEPRPAEYSEGYGELVRAYRSYIGVSQRTMADKIGIGERSLSDIEVGRRRCPKGFINSVEKVVVEHEDAVEKLVEFAGDQGETIIEVSDDPAQEWTRSIVGRAGVTTPHIRPVLKSQQHP
jgi:predicted transcriptional regulator